MSYKIKPFEGTKAALDKAILASVEANHIWLNAMQCVRPTDEFCAQLGRQVIAMAMERNNCLPSQYGGEPNDAVGDMAQLTPTLYLSVNAS